MEKGTVIYQRFKLAFLITCCLSFCLSCNSFHGFYFISRTNGPNLNKYIVHRIKHETPFKGGNNYETVRIHVVGVLLKKSSSPEPLLQKCKYLKILNCWNCDPSPILELKEKLNVYHWNIEEKYFKMFFSRTALILQPPWSSFSHKHPQYNIFFHLH